MLQYDVCNIHLLWHLYSNMYSCILHTQILDIPYSSTTKHILHKINNTEPSQSPRDVITDEFKLRSMNFCYSVPKSSKPISHNLRFKISLIPKVSRIKCYERRTAEMEIHECMRWYIELSMRSNIYSHSSFSTFFVVIGVAMILCRDATPSWCHL